MRQRLRAGDGRAGRRWSGRPDVVGPKAEVAPSGVFWPGADVSRPEVVGSEADVPPPVVAGPEVEVGSVRGGWAQGERRPARGGGA